MSLQRFSVVWRGADEFGDVHQHRASASAPVHKAVRRTLQGWKPPWIHALSLSPVFGPHRRPRILLHLKEEQGVRAEQVGELLLEHGRIT